MKKIYIAGKIKGECETPEKLKWCRMKFLKYANSDYIKVFFGLDINRSLIDAGVTDYNLFMSNCLAVIPFMDEVHFLPDWVNSPGSKVEHDLAVSLNKKIVYVL